MFPQITQLLFSFEGNPERAFHVRGLPAVCLLLPKGWMCVRHTTQQVMFPFLEFLVTALARHINSLREAKPRNLRQLDNDREARQAIQRESRGGYSTQGETRKNLRLVFFSLRLMT